MKRWEDNEIDPDENAEEIHLLKKFQDYLRLEENELEKRRGYEYHRGYPQIRKNQKLVLGLLEGTVLVGLTAAFLFLLSMQ